jgi:hypothetical protein
MKKADIVIAERLAEMATKLDVTTWNRIVNEMVVVLTCRRDFSTDLFRNYLQGRALAHYVRASANAASL